MPALLRSLAPGEFMRITMPLLILWPVYVLSRGVDSSGLSLSSGDVATAALHGLAGLVAAMLIAASADRRPLRLFALAAAICALAALLDEALLEPLLDPAKAADGLNPFSFWFAFSEAALFVLAAAAITFIRLFRREAAPPTPPISEQPALSIPIGRARRIVDPAEIVRIEADRDFTRIHLLDGKLHASISLAALLRQLPPHFVRTHRSHVVNAAHVSETAPRHVRTAAGEVPVGRRYRDSLEPLRRPLA